MALPLYKPLPTSPHSRPVRPTPKRNRPLIWIVAGGVLTIFMVSGLAGTGQMGNMSWSSERQPEPHNRVFLRAGSIGPEGFGSALNHFKQSIILSRALDSTLVLTSENSEHHYSTSQLYNGRMGAAPMDARNACRMRDHVPTARRNALVRGWCAGDPAVVEEMERIKADMVNCTGIVDLDEDERTEDLHGCIMGWVRERLAPAAPPLLPQPLSWPPTRSVTVGVHIRWGDAAGWSDVAGQFRGSMALSNIVRVLKDLRLQVGQHGVNLTVAMENADPAVLAQLGGEHTLLDSGDALADVLALSTNDYLLLGDSAYGVMAHLLAAPGLTIAELSVDNGKYENTTAFGRNVVFMPDYTPENLRWPLNSTGISSPAP
ncbi:hypothetical protein DFH09DRAFT_1275442 [Mycena vulgaris]|nr:hypothetical protein DFH09DRAFT_1275442 [Mycena vulgaris]